MIREIILGTLFCAAFVASIIYFANSIVRSYDHIKTEYIETCISAGISIEVCRFKYLNR